MKSLNFVLLFLWIHGTEGQNYTVTSVLEYPYMIDNGNGTFSGYMVDLLTDLGKRDGFSYEIRLNSEGKYGEEQNGQWTGMIGELLDSNEDIDIAAAPLVITDKRRSAIPFTRPFMTESFRILIKKPMVQSFNVKVLFQPFSLPLWIMVIVICFIVSAMLFIVNKFSPSEWSKVKPEDDPTNARDSFSANNAFFFVHSTLTWQGYKEVPRSPAGRILVTMWFSFVFFMIIAYTANLTAFLIVRGSDKLVVPFKSWEEMTSQSSVSYGFSMSGMFQRTLKDSTDPTLQIVSRNVDTHYTYFHSYEEAVKQVRDSDGTFAAIIPVNKGIEFLNEEPCDLLMVGARVLQIPHAMACKSEDICNRLNFAMLRMYEDGTMHQLRLKWLDVKSKCPAYNLDDYVSKHETSQLTAKPLSISDTSLAFVVLLIGIVFSMIFLAIEVLIHRRRKTKSSNISTKGNTNNMATSDDVEQAKLTDDQEQAPIASNET